MTGIPLRGGRLKSGRYDERAQELEIEFVSGDVKRFKGVPVDVWGRLQAAPNPASYYEDRIEEEYAVTAGERRVDSNSARSKMDDLFSAPDD